MFVMFLSVSCGLSRTARVDGTGMDAFLDILWKGVGEANASRSLYVFSGNKTWMAQSAVKQDTGICRAVINAVRALRDDVAKAVSTAPKAMEHLLGEKYRNQEWEKRKRDFRLIEKLAEGHTSISGFMEEYLLDPVHGTEVEGLEDAVTVMTIHSAKGTECKVCYVVNVSPGAYPSAYARDDEDKVEEERRVLYVALTRAKDELIVTRRGYGLGMEGMCRTGCNGDETDVAGYFLNGLPDGLLDEYVHVVPSSNFQLEIGIE